MRQILRREDFWQQLELMEAGKIGTIEWNGAASVDTTAQTIEQFRVKLATLEALLIRLRSLANVGRTPQKLDRLHRVR